MVIQHLVAKGGDRACSEIGSGSSSGQSSVILDDIRSLRGCLGNSGILKEGKVALGVWEDGYITTDDVLVLM